MLGFILQQHEVVHSLQERKHPPWDHQGKAARAEPVSVGLSGSSLKGVLVAPGLGVEAGETRGCLYTPQSLRCGTGGFCPLTAVCSLLRWQSAAGACSSDCRLLILRVVRSAGQPMSGTLRLFQARTCFEFVS